MKKLALDNPKAIAAVLVRRKWWLLVSAALGVFAAFYVAIVLPPIYLSDTLIRIKVKEVPDTFVPDLIGIETDQRLSAIQQTILSRKILLQILNQNPIQELANLNQEEKIERLRQRIGIEFERPDRRAPATHFRISFQSRSPQQAQTVTEQLAQEFIKEDERTRSEQVGGAEDFFRGEVQRLEEQLRAEEEALSRWKSRYQYELPEQLESNLRTLDRLEEQRTANAEALDRAQSEKMSLERQISDTPPMMESTVRTPASPGAAREVSPLVEEYRETERYLASLANKTEKFPGVQQARAKLERLRKEIPPEDLLEIEAPETIPQAVYTPNPVYQSLVAQLDQVKTDLEIRQREKEKIDREIRRYETYVANTPQREREQAEKERRYNELQEQYSERIRRLADTELAGNLEDVQKGEQFRIVDHASLPSRPAKPNRRLIVLLGCLASLGLGAAVALGRDLLDQTFWTYQEVEEFFGVPILIEIPQILSPQEQAAKRRWAWVAPALFTIFILAGSAALFWVYTTPAIRTWSGEHLDILARLAS